MGRLYDIIEKHKHESPYRVTNAGIADRLKVSKTTVGNWENLKQLPTHENLVGISRITGVPYRVVLEAALYDIGYDTAELRNDPSKNQTRGSRGDESPDERRKQA